MIILVNTYDGNINKTDIIECTDDVLCLQMLGTIIDQTDGYNIEIKSENEMLLCLVYEKETLNLIKQIEYVIFDEKNNDWVKIKSDSYEEIC